MTEPVTAPVFPLTAVAHPERSFGRSVLALRLARGWTQGRLAAEAGLSEASVRRLENGHGGCTLDTAWRIAEALEADVDAMIRGGAR